MTKKPNGAAPAEQFVKMPRGLMASDAWLSMRAGHLKIISALCEEHMRHGGRDNGKLKAPHRQLAKLGIAPRKIAGCIRDLELWGLIECERGGMRTATRYALAWLPRADGRPPSNAWRDYRAPETAKSAHEREGRAAHEREGRRPNLHTKGEADWPQNLHTKGKALSRIPLPRTGDTYSVSQGEAPAMGAVRLRAGKAGGL